MGPAVMGDETRVARQGQQAAAPLATARRQLGREHAAQRPAPKPGIVRQRRIEFVEPFTKFAGLKRRQGFDLYLQMLVQAVQRSGQRLQR